MACTPACVMFVKLPSEANWLCNRKVLRTSNVAMRFESYDDLPSELQKRILDLFPNDHHEWVKQRIPALGYLSPLSVAGASPDGMRQLESLLDTFESHF